MKYSQLRVCGERNYPTFFWKVVFENEPYIEYIYFAHNDVIQFEYLITEEGKQKGITENDLINYNLITEGLRLLNYG